jgi:hypothetical protein
MKTTILSLSLLLVILSTAIHAGNSSDNPFHYSRLNTGDRITYKELQREHLGRVCTVYLKAGFPESMVGGILPTGALIHDKPKGISLLIGELYAITKDGVRLRWYYDLQRTSTTEYGAGIEEIDYIT